MLFADSKSAVSTSTGHVQPVQELGESRNLHIELPVRNIPKSVLPLEAFNWKKELEILEAIVKEDFCDKTSNNDFCMETTLSSYNSIRSIKSVDELNAGESVIAVNTALFESLSSNQSPSEVTDEAEFSQISNEGSLDDRSSLIAWINSIQKTGRSNEGMDSEFENYLNQPAKKADLDWQTIHVPEIESQPQILEETFVVQTDKKSPSKARKKRASNRPLLQLVSRTLTDDVAKGIEPRSKNAILPPPRNTIKGVISSPFSRREVALNSKSYTLPGRTAAETATRCGKSNVPLESGMDNDDLRSLQSNDGIESTGATLSMDLIDLNTPESLLESQTDEETLLMIDGKASGLAGNDEDVDKKNSTHDNDVGHTAEVSSMDLIDLRTPECSAVEGFTDHEANEMAVVETSERFSDIATIADTSA